MKSLLARHALYDSPEFAETESALALSPCPRIEESQGSGIRRDFASRRGESPYPHRSERPGQSVLDNNDLTESLTIAWALALAIAVALVISISGV